MVDAGVWRDEFQEELNEIYSSCNTCKLYGKTPARPVVSMPMATRFNEKVAMDLKSWKGKYILHMIDMFTRLSISVFINRKTPEEVVENVLQHGLVLQGRLGVEKVGNQIGKIFRDHAPLLPGNAHILQTATTPITKSHQIL